MSVADSTTEASDEPPLFGPVFFLGVSRLLPLLHYLSSYTRRTRILNFLPISHISILVGNSINFPLSSQQPGLSNLGIFTLQAPAQHGEYRGPSWQGATNIPSVSASIFFLFTLVENCYALIFVEWSFCQKTHPAQLGRRGPWEALVDPFCSAELRRSQVIRFLLCV